MRLVIVLLFLSMVACAPFKGDRGDRGDQGISATVEDPPIIVADEVQTDIDVVIADENDYRLGIGQTMLSPGLSCTLSTITGGQRIQATSGGFATLTGITQVATYLYKEVFNQPDSSSDDGINVLPLALRSLYKNLYLLRCQGYVVVTQSDYYKFDLSSDDASLLYVDGAKLIDNDNNHGVLTVSNQKYLRRGVHAFRLDYAQAGAGNQALILKANNALIEGRYYTH